MSEKQLKMTVDEIVNRVTDILHEIVKDWSSDTRPKISYGNKYEDDFFLTRFGGGEGSIEALVQLIMYDDEIWKKILSEDELEEFEQMIVDMREAGESYVYQPDDLYETIGSIHSYSIAFILKKLRGILDEENGYIGSQEDYAEEGYDLDDYRDPLKSILEKKIEHDCTTAELPFEDDELTVESISNYVCLITNSIFNEGLQSSCNPDEQDDYHQIFAYFYDDNSITEEFLIVVPSDSTKITGGSLSSKDHDDRSLEALIFSVLYAKGIYEQLLSNEQFERLGKMLELYRDEEIDSDFNGEQDSILFVPQLTDENYGELMPLLSQIYLNVINFVKNKLAKLGYQSDKIFDDYVENHAPFATSSLDGSQNVEATENSVAVEIDEDHAGLAFLLNATFKEGMSDLELFEITRGVWHNVPRDESLKFAYAMHNDIVQEVYEIKNWVKAGTQEYQTRSFEGRDISKKWEFVGQKASDDVRNKYVGKSIVKNRSYGSPFVKVGFNADVA